MKTLREHWIEIIGAVVAVLAIHAFLFAEAYRGDHIDAAIAGQFGDFIGGYLGTIFLIVSVALLAASYKNQKATNEATLREQITVNQKTSFEARFFELLKFHRENVAEIGIGEKFGRRVFVSLVREFRGLRDLVDAVCKDRGVEYPLRARNDLAYVGMYYGVGPNSTRVLEAAVATLHPKELVDEIIKRMADMQSAYMAYEKLLKQPAINDESRQERLMEGLRALNGRTRVGYCPYNGHQSRLGHYYRHLFQLITYVKSNAPVGTAQEYADMVRAQLTNHEQALLCLNSKSKVGAAWIELGYLTEFSLIQNIPKDFFDPIAEMDIETEFPTIRFEFMKQAESSPNPSGD